MKLEFPSDENFSRGLMCHDSMLKLLKKAWLIRSVQWSKRMNLESVDPAEIYTMMCHPLLTDAADAAIISVIRSLIAEEHIFLTIDRPNIHAELQKLLNDFLKSHRPTRAKKTAKQPTP